jgi:hypothetical protein
MRATSRWSPIVVLALACATGRSAHAQTAEELGAARQLFNEALKDEESKRFGTALDKYKRVQQVKDTVPIRYRIGSAYEGLGRPVQAIAAYQSAVQMGQSNGSDADIVRAANERIAVLEGKVAHINITLSEHAPADTEVKIDDEPVPRESMNDVRVNPGVHAVTATAKEARAFRAQISLPEGGRAEMPVTLESTKEPPKPPPRGSSTKTVGLITAIAGGVLFAGGAVALILRNRDVDKLRSTCSGEGNSVACPAAQQDELQSAHDRALALGPLGVTLGTVGAVALGVGIVLVVTSPSEPAKAATFLAPSFTPGGGGITMMKTF